MLEIQRLKIIIITDNGTYGFDEKFTRGLNFIAIIEIDVGQTIVAITIEDSDTKEAIAALNPDSYNIIRIKKRAFVKMSEENEVE